MSSAKLPKSVTLMVEKNNLVMAIKTLAEEENISMDEAKQRIDRYETELKTQQQQKLQKIANKQGIKVQSAANPSITTDVSKQISTDLNNPHTQSASTTSQTHTHNNASFSHLNSGIDNRLADMGYKKPLLPYWVKRLAIIIAVMAVLFWILWRVFG